MCNVPLHHSLKVRKSGHKGTIQLTFVKDALILQIFNFVRSQAFLLYSLSLGAIRVKTLVPLLSTWLDVVDGLLCSSLAVFGLRLGFCLARLIKFMLLDVYVHVFNFKPKI
jgi:hypothetical protein